MTDFLIKSTLSLIVLIAVYFLILEKEKMAVFNRFYLLFSLLFSFSLPFLTIEVMTESPDIVMQETTLDPGNPVSVVPEISVNYFPIILWILYGIGTSLFLFRFIKNVLIITSRSKTNTILKYKKSKLILLEEKILPHTFLNTIYINKEDYENRNIEKELYTHELTHVNQKHTLDILFIETIKCFFWFNPILILYKKAIQLNHEFLADEKVVKTFKNIPAYQSLLLSKATQNQPYYLASNLNYLVTKKRLIMMSKNTSVSISILKKTAITPILAGLIFFMCVKSTAQEKNSNDNNNTKTYPASIGSYYSGVRFIYLEGVKKELKINKLYEELTEIEKEKFKLVFKNGIQKPIEKKSPTQKEFDNFKDSKKYAIWINGTHVPNAELNKYKPDEIADFSGSVVLKNARSKKFPQPFQYWFNTHKYYDENKMGEQIKKYPGDTIKVWSVKKQEKKSAISTTIPSMKEDEKTQNNESSEIKSAPKLSENQNSTSLEETTNPSFPGGFEAFYNYVSANFKKNENFKGSGRIYLIFMVEKDGSISEIEILRDLGFGLGDEAVRVLKESPKWIPGKLNGKPIRSKYSLPISIVQKT